MKAVCFLLALLLSAAASALADDAAAYREARVPDTVALPATVNHAYRLLVPEGAGKDGAKFPLVIYLHGSGAKGTDNRKQLGEVVPRLLATKELRAKFPCFVLVPQCRTGDDALGRPNNWVKWENQKGTQPAEWLHGEAEASDQLRAAMVALDDVLATQAVDKARIYLTGVSMGGSASWSWAAREPQRFAAVITACGLSEVAKAPALAKLPVWAFHGSDDPIAPVARSRSMVEALRALGAPVKFTEYTGAGHGIGDRVFTENKHAVFTWLFTQRRAE